MRLGIRTVLVGLLACATAAPAVAHATSPPLRPSVQRLYSFDGTGDACLLLSGSVDPGKGRALFAQVEGEADKTGGAPARVFFPQVIDLDNTDPHTYGTIGQRDLCPDPRTVCHLLPGGGLGFTSTVVVSGDDQHIWHLRFAIVVTGAKVTFKEKMIGWRGRDLRGTQQVTNDQADGTGATGFGASAGATLAATAPAGAWGSIAIATPPCDVAGAGIALLTGPGGVSTPGICPTDAFGAATNRSGSWNLTGPAAGISSRSTRLLVLDL